MAININGTTITGGGGFSVTNSSSTQFFDNTSQTYTLSEGAQYIEGTPLFNSNWRMSKVERRAGRTFFTASRSFPNGGSPGFTRDIFVITPSHGWTSYSCKFKVYADGYSSAGYAEYLLDGTGGDYTGVIRTVRAGAGGVQPGAPTLRTNTPIAGPNNYYDGDSQVLQTVQMTVPSWVGCKMEVEWTDNFSLVSSITANWQIQLKGD